MSMNNRGRHLFALSSPSETEISVADYLDDWLEGKQSLRPSTRLSYATHIRLYLTPYLGRLPLDAVRPLHIQRMYKEMVMTNDGDKPLSVATLKRVHATLMSALNTAVKQGLIERNPAATVELPPSTRTRLPVWSATELGGFLDAISNDRLHLLYLLLGLRGLRRGEAVALRWSDVDLARGLLRIEQSAVSVSGRTVTGAPKSASGARFIAIDEHTVRLLHWHRARQRLELFKHHACLTKPDLVFTRPDGRPLNPTYVTRHFDRLVVKHGLPRIRLHDLRHTSALDRSLQWGEPG
jgi:integrase